MVWQFLEEHTRGMLHAVEDPASSLATVAAGDGETEGQGFVGVKTSTLILVAGITTLVTCLVAAGHIAHHVRNWYDNLQQQYQVWICRIILVVPIYAICSFFCLLLPASLPVWEVIKDTYEGYAVYAFLVLHVNFLGGEENIVRSLEGISTERVSWAFPCQCLRPFQPNHKTLNIIRIGVMQYVFLRPLGALITAICSLQGVWHDGSMSPKGGYFWVFVMNNISVCVALYFLWMFYAITKKRVVDFNPFPKFMVLKAFIWVPWAQTMLFLLIASISMSGKTLDYHELVRFESMLTCCEMTIFSFVFVWVFPVDDLWRFSEGVNPEQTQPINKVGAIFAGHTDMAEDVRNAFGDEETNEVRMTAKNPRARDDYDDAEA